MTKLLELLDRLSDPYRADKLIDIITLLRLIQEDPDYELVSSYFVNKFRNGIRFDEVLNVMKSLSTNETFSLSLSGKLNEIIIWQYSQREHPEYLYYLLDKDPRSKRPLINDLCQWLASLAVSDTNYHIQNICSNSSCKELDLYYITLGFCVGNGSGVRELMIIKELSLDLKYSLLSRSIEQGHLLIVSLKDIFANKYFYKYVQDRLSDDCLLCNAIRVSPLSTLHIQNHYFKDCLFTKYHLIPKTIKHIFDRSVQENNLALLSEMGDVYSKKEILRALVVGSEFKENRFYLDNFIKMNKDSEEVRRLLPFI